MMAELKTKPTGQSVTAFIANIDNPQHKRMAKQVSRIMREHTSKRARMWGASIVGYDTYSYTTAAGHSAQWMLTGFSPRKRDFTIYIMNGFSRYQKILKRLGPHKVSKSCLYINKPEEIDFDVLDELIAHSVVDMREMYPDE